MGNLGDIRGYANEQGSSDWHPIAVVKVGDEYVLKVSDISGGGGGATLGVPKHYNGTANVISATVNFAATTKSFYIENLHATNDLFVSFDSGVSTFKIPSGESLSLDTAITSVDVSASVDGTNYQLLTTE